MMYNDFYYIVNIYLKIKIVDVGVIHNQSVCNDSRTSCFETILNDTWAIRNVFMQ